MNGTYIALCISSDEIKLAEVSLENGRKVIKALRRIEIPRDRADLFFKEPLRERPGEELPKFRKCFLVISSEDLTYRDFSLPFRSSRKVTSAIGFEVSSEYPSDQYILDPIETISSEPGRHAFLAAIVRKEILAKRTQQAEDLGFTVTGITCDLSSLGNYFVDENEALVMEAGQRQTLFVLYSHRTPILVRDIPIGLRDIPWESGNPRHEVLRPLASEVKRTVHSFSARTGYELKTVHLSGDLLSHPGMIDALNEMGDFGFMGDPPVNRDFTVEDEKPGLNLYASLLGTVGWKKKTRVFDFYREEFIGTPGTILSRSALQWGTLVVVSFLFAWLLSSWLNIVALGQREKFLAAEIRRVFSTSFPQVTRVVDEVKQARSLLGTRKTEVGNENLFSSVPLLDVMERISSTIPKEFNFQVVNLFWERGRIEIDGRTDSFKTVNSIQELLSKSKDFPEVTISNAKTRSDGQDVEFKITVRIAG